jgi:YidC/Oxa1 family membrane protein insertase
VSADYVQQMNPNAFGPEPPAPDMKRLLLTVVLCTSLIYVWQVLNPPVVPPDAAADAGPGAEPTAQAAPAPVEQPAAPAVDATPAQIPEKTFVFDADVAAAMGKASEGVKGGYHAVISNHGAQLSGFELTGYVDGKSSTADKAANIQLSNGEHDGAGIFAIRSRGGDVKLGADDGYNLVNQTDTSIELARRTSAGVVVTRKYSFDPKRFAFDHELVLKNEGSSRATAEIDVVFSGAERPGERDSGGGMFMPSSDQLAAVCAAGDERERWTSAELEEPEKLAGGVRYAAIDRHFFMGAVVMGDGPRTTGCDISGWKQTVKDGGEGLFGVEGLTEEQRKAFTEQLGLALVVHYEPVSLAPGEARTIKHAGYFGPKQLGLLQDMGSGLDENIEFGWFGLLSRPMLWVLVKFYDFFGNFGIAIILLTLLMKLLTFPLTQKSYVSMQQMKTVAPELKKLQEKYKHDRAALGQKQMEMYREKGINPMAGCFPMLVQMPIWFALYRTLWNSVELYQQPFIAGITDLSQPEQLLFGFPLLPILVGVLMLGQTMLQPPPQDQPQMKYVMWGMPIMFTFFMLQMPSGLSLYMITNSVLTMAQQFFIKRKYATA